MQKIKNNPILEIKTSKNIYKIQTIGDPHLGRTFRTGVPSSKFGVREALVLKDFQKLLNPNNDLEIDFVVVVGDLFDKFIVKPSVVDNAVTLIEEAIVNNPDIIYFIIPGNHDLSRDKTKVSSYHLFQKIFENENELETSNLNIVYLDSLFYHVDDELLLYFDAYNPFHKNPEETLITLETLFEKELKDTSKQVVSFGHWDNPHNDFASYLPSNFILKYSDMIVSGHIHTPDRFRKDSIEYVYTGSLQPYSHAEDPSNILYKTISYIELEDKLSKKDESFLESISNINLRINCYPGYLISEPVESLSLIYNNILEIPKEITEDLELIEVDSNKITDFTSLYLYKLKYEYEIEEDLIIKINNFLKDSSEDVSFTLDQE